MKCSLLFKPRAGKTGRSRQPARRWLLTLLTVLASAAGALAQTVTIGSTAVPAVSPATSEFFYGPIYQPGTTTAPNYSRYAYLYTAAELGIPSGSTITQLDWLKADGNTVAGNNSLEVLLGSYQNNTLSASTWGMLTAGVTSVYSSNTRSIAGPAGVYLTVPTTGYTYTGGNLLVLTDWTQSGAASGNINFITNPAAGMSIGETGVLPFSNSITLSANYGDRRPTLRITYVPNTACTAPPTAGMVVATAGTVCAGRVVSLTLSGATSGTGLTYQWQASTTGVAGSYTTISGATSSSYTTPALTQTQYYRALVTCSGQTATSMAAQVTVLAPTYAAIPYIQGFEAAWLSRCGTGDVPDASWRNTPVTGDDSWRRDDDGASANWQLPADGAYSPAGSNAGGANSTHSARFHNYYAPVGSVGTLDLHVNLGGGAGTPTLKFDYNNSDTNLVQVLLSTDGGVTFPTTLQTLASNAAWTSYLLPLPSTVTATTVIRFRATSNFGLADSGIDNVSVSYVTCAQPTGLAVAVTPAGATATASLTFTPVAGAASYTLGLSPPVAGAPTTVAASPVSLTGLAYGTTYTVTLTTTCASSTSQASAYVFTTPCAPPAYATLPYTQGFEAAWLSRCGTSDVPDGNWRNTPVTGDDSWRRDDDGASANWQLPGVGAYTPAGSASSHSARFHSYSAQFGAMGSLDLYVNLSAAGTKTLTFDYLNNSTSGSQLEVLLSTDGGATFATNPLLTLTVATAFAPQSVSLATTSATAVIRFRATSDFGSDDLGLDNVQLRVQPAVDLAATSLVTPLVVQGCYSSAEAVAAGVTNVGQALNFATNPATVTAVVTLPGGTTQTLTATVNTGTLVAGAIRTVTLAPTLNMSLAGTYSFVLTVAATGDTNPANNTLTPAVIRIAVAAPATPTITTMGSPATGITLTSSAPTGNQWYLNGMLIVGATGQTYLVNSGVRNGSYTVVASSGGCASAPSAAVAVTVTATTTARSLALALALHPNPTPNGLVTLELANATSPTELTVLDALGRVVLTRQLPANASRYELDLGAASSGVYLLRLRNADGVATRRLVRE